MMQNQYSTDCRRDGKRLFARTVDKAMSPFEDFVHKETSSGILLIICAVLAIAIANSPLFPLYDKILHTKITVGGGPFVLSLSLHHWINDGLMVIFFFVVGLEVKREMLIGELANFKKAVLPISAAIGGMVVPALCYLLFNIGGDGVDGWGIPMATDIAFALGVIAMLGKRVPKALIALLLAIAIVDDLGAVLVIAVLYTETINLGALLMAVVCFLLLIGTNRAGVRRPLPYGVFGILMWLAMLKSGVHATLAGVLTALTVPASSFCDAGLFADRMGELAGDFRKQIASEGKESRFNILSNVNKQTILLSMESIVHKMESPLHRMEHHLHVWVSFLIVPLFALANAGIPIDFSVIGTVVQHPVTLGVMAGLIFGKVAGIFLFSWVVVKLGWSSLPGGVKISQVAGVGLLGGIGFTMSIFIGSLAFPANLEYLINAKIGIVLASLIAGILGYLWLLKTTDKPADF
jgi:NhaA family Na+:H+ antiporter